MQQTHLDTLLRRRLGEDHDAAVAEHAAQEPGADREAFLAWLLRTGRIDTTDFLDLHGTAAVQLDDSVTRSMGASSTLALDADFDADPDPDEPLLETDADRFVPLVKIGEGAMGSVHLARDTRLGRKVALKTLRADQDGMLARQRFVHEVQVTAQLDHPYVPPVYGLEVDRDGAPSYAMKLLSGRTLDVVLDACGRDPTMMPLRARLEVLIKACDAMAHAHAKGVVHRDLKPSNLMVGPHHEVWVLDWGVAWVREMAQTASTSVLGTPRYMAPEQARGDGSALGPHTDVYALGLVLYELVYLERAIAGGQATAVVASAVTRGPLVLPRSGRDGVVSEELRAILAHATAPVPEDRYPNAGALGADLRSHLADEETVALPDTTPRRITRWLRRHQHATLLGLAAMASLVVVVGVTSAQQRQLQVAAERLATQTEEHRASELFAAASMRAQVMDSQFLWYERQLAGIAGAAAQAMQHGVPVKEPAYSALDYASGRTPPDLLSAPAYGRPISTRWPVYKAPPGADPVQIAHDLGQLAPLRASMRSIFRHSPSGPSIPDADVAALLVGGELEVIWVYLALEESGLMYMLPGARGWEADYDARTRPWYRHGVDQSPRRTSWGRPYVDRMGQGRLITATLPLLSNDDRLLGVAGLDLRVGGLVEDQLSMPLHPSVVGTYVIDATGAVMLSSETPGLRYRVPPTTQQNDQLEFGQFPDPDILQMAAQGHSGMIRVSSAEGPLRMAVVRLDHVGWYLVVVADERVLNAREASARKAAP